MPVISLKQRVLIPFAIACIFLFVLSLVGIYHEEQGHTEQDLIHSVNVTRESYHALLKDSAEKLNSAAGFIVRDERIHQAIRARDREALLSIVQPTYKRLLTSHNITHFYIHDESRINFLRAHQPGRFGDTINRYTAIEAERSGKPAWGAELGPLGTFTMRTVFPIRDGVELLGYVELGEEIEKKTRELAEMYGVDLLLLISKQYLNKEDWKAGMRMLDRQSHWDALPDFAIPFQSTPDFPLELLSDIELINPSSPVRMIMKRHNGRAYHYAYISLVDAGNRVVGSILVSRDMNPRMESTYKTIVGISAIAIFVGLSLFGLFYYILSKTEQQLENRRQRVMEEAQARLDMQEKHLHELEQLALFDSLTGLPNRKSLDDRWNQIISELEQSPDQEESRYLLMLLDLNRMRDINDALGHDVGDNVLQEVAKRLQQDMSEADIIASFGGNEFALLQKIGSLDQYEEPVTRLKALFDRPFVINDMALAVSAKVGVVHYPEHGSEVSELIRRADVAMRQAKKRAKFYQIYDSERDPHSVRRLALIEELRKAINQQELMLYYQPQVDAFSGRLVGVEALTRWLHPSLGEIAPLEFIPLAEQTGLIEPLTRWVLDEAMQQCRVWVDQGLDIKMSVNVSVHNMMDASLPDKVAGLLEQHQLSPERMMLEVTESVFMHDPEDTLTALNRLKTMGVALSIDDFGTGYSSLAYLKQLPVHEVKIDQGFIFDMLENDNDAMIVSSTIALAHNLGLTVVAEGVERLAVWNSLKALSCDTIQGFYVSPPLKAEELDAWLHVYSAGFTESQAVK